MPVELPNEAIAYQYQSLLAPVGEEWSAAAELRAHHFLAPGRLKELLPRLMQCRSQVAAERDIHIARTTDMRHAEVIALNARLILASFGDQNGRIGFRCLAGPVDDD